MRAAPQTSRQGVLVGIEGASADIRIGQIGTQKTVPGIADRDPADLLQDGQINPLISILVRIAGIGPAHERGAFGVGRKLREQHHLVGDTVGSGIVFPITAVYVFLFVLVLILEDNGEGGALILAGVLVIAPLHDLPT